MTLLRAARIAALGIMVLALPLAACKDEESAPEQRITGLNSFVKFIQKTGGLKSLNTYYKKRPEILSEESLGVLYDGARTEGEVMRFKEKQLAKEMLPALQAVRRRLGETENCELRGYFVACGEEKFVDVFRKWQ